MHTPAVERHTPGVERHTPGLRRTTARDAVTSRTAGPASRNDVRSMRRSIPLLLFLIACSTPVPIRFGAHHAAAPVVAASNPSFADGDPFAGRRTFIALQCTDCHRVAEDPSLPPGHPVTAGPLLANMQRFTPHRLAGRISSPADAMKPYSQPMTARQMVDVVAYLRHPPTSGRG